MAFSLAFPVLALSSIEGRHRPSWLSTQLIFLLSDSGVPIQRHNVNPNSDLAEIKNHDYTQSEGGSELFDRWRERVPAWDRAT